jgi:hypothetical protein
MFQICAFACQALQVYNTKATEDWILTLNQGVAARALPVLEAAKKSLSWQLRTWSDKHDDPIETYVVGGYVRCNVFVQAISVPSRIHVQKCFANSRQVLHGVNMQLPCA